MASVKFGQPAKWPHLSWYQHSPMPSTSWVRLSSVVFETSEYNRAQANSTEYDVSRVQTWAQFWPARNLPSLTSAAITRRAFS